MDRLAVWSFVKGLQSAGKELITRCSLEESEARSELHGIDLAENLDWGFSIRPVGHGLDRLAVSWA